MILKNEYSCLPSQSAEKVLEQVLGFILCTDSGPLNIYERLWVLHETELENYSDFFINKLKKRAGCYEEPLKEKIGLKHWGSCGDIAFSMGEYEDAEVFYLKKEWHDVDENDCDIRTINHFGIINMSMYLNDWSKAVKHLLKADIVTDPADDKYLLIDKAHGCSKKIFFTRAALIVVMTSIKNSKNSRIIQERIGVNSDDWEALLCVMENASEEQIQKEIRKTRPLKKAMCL